VSWCPKQISFGSLSFVHIKHLLRLTTTSWTKLSPDQPLQGSESGTDTRLVPLERTLHRTCCILLVVWIRFVCSIRFFGCSILFGLFLLVSILGSELTYHRLRACLDMSSANFHVELHRAEMGIFGHWAEVQVTRKANIFRFLQAHECVSDSPCVILTCNDLLERRVKTNGMEGSMRYINVTSCEIARIVLDLAEQAVWS
jgi:hypothetical protein